MPDCYLLATEARRIRLRQFVLCAQQIAAVVLLDLLLQRARRARRQGEARVDRVQMRHRHPSDTLSEGGKRDERYRDGDHGRKRDNAGHIGSPQRQAKSTLQRWARRVDASNALILPPNARNECLDNGARPWEGMKPNRPVDKRRAGALGYRQPQQTVVSAIRLRCTCSEISPSGSNAGPARGSPATLRGRRQAIARLFCQTHG